ncbi:hypothetical protein LZ023_40635 (plasmid) [Pseudomonas silvicola]|nr:hypothetical protein LZ023_40910 [Pseudomonas silvicola]WAH62242.1 hypothetical protein LZ023_40635 [Pseudomonas silvicola]
MNKPIKPLLVVLLASLVAGCNAAEGDARKLVDAARASWDAVMPAAPGASTGNLVLNADKVNACVKNLQDASDDLAEVYEKYANTDVAKAPDTQALKTASDRQLATCKQIKHVQGW